MSDQENGRYARYVDNFIELVNSNVGNYSEIRQHINSDEDNFIKSIFILAIDKVNVRDLIEKIDKNLIKLGYFNTVAISIMNLVVNYDYNEIESNQRADFAEKMIEISILLSNDDLLTEGSIYYSRDFCRSFERGYYIHARLLAESFDLYKNDDEIIKHIKKITRSLLLSGRQLPDNNYRFWEYIGLNEHQINQIILNLDTNDRSLECKV